MNGTTALEQINENLSNMSPTAKGRRLKGLRKMTGLSRRAFAEKHQINPNTLQNWEDGKSGGLNEKSAKRVILALREEGIQVSKKWLLEGEGVKPYISDVIYEDIEITGDMPKDAASITDEEQSIIAEIQAFRSFYEDSIDFLITDDAMEPQYLAGDRVAGVNVLATK